MERRVLGRTGIEVSRLCFGSLTVSPLQSSLPVQAGSALIRYAMGLGVNCIDTAEYYRNYSMIAQAGTDPSQLRLITKCYAYDAKGAKESLQRALEATGRSYIDVIMLHEQESEWTLRGHSEALDFFVEAKQAGLIGAVGISTHYVACAWACAGHPKVDVIEAICNESGLGIPDGTQEEMNQALEVNHRNGKGVVAMKPLGGGHLCAEPLHALAYVQALPFIDSIAIGMQTKEEVKLNCLLFEGTQDEILLNTVKRTTRSLHIADWCIGCGACVERCSNKALRIENGQACVDKEKCALCGYCAGVCRDFCIKVY